MSNLNLSINMDRVQSSVQASIRPAVESALAEIDIKAKIIEALTVPLRVDPYRMMLLMDRDHYSTAPTLLDGMIQEGISNVAQEYVQRWIGECRGDIEEAFRKMMAGSSNRLVKAFAAATEKALKEDWAFNLKVEVEHSTSASDDD